MGGLKAEIADGIRMFKPKSLKEAISLARMKDDQLNRQGKILRVPVQLGVGSQPVAITNPLPPVKRLAWDERQRRRAQGLYFNYDKKFTPGHKGHKSQLLLLENEKANGVLPTNPKYEPKISLHALTSWSPHKTMQVKATIESHELIVLIDSGSTHNFISERIANILQLPIKSTKPFNVKIANGRSLTCQGRFEDVSIRVQGIPFYLIVYALPLSGLDLVLGVEWLEQLGTVECNWRQLTMKFTWNNQSHKLQGINGPINPYDSLKTISKDLKGKNAAFMVYLQSVKVSTQQAHPDIQRLMQEFNEIFQDPKQLPPVQNINHHIILKEGTTPVNVRPYRYAYFQKAEIKKQVNDKLNLRLTRPSTSPFSSPVLLVKKEDGTWRFYTDYQALNEVTIKDKFPIPTIDDMLDELHGAAFFTKLDL